MIKSVDASQIIDIRHQVLRPSQDRSACCYPEDQLQDSQHFAYFESNRIVSCASIYKESHPDFPEDLAFRIRGMATLTDHRGKGLGSQLLMHCAQSAKSESAKYIWCNARISASIFYIKGNFQISGKEFEMADIGPHYLMYQQL